MARVFFDYDGVIADSLPAVLSCFNALGRELDATQELTSQRIATFPDVTFDRLARDVGIPESRIGEFLETFFERLAGLADEISTFPGMRELLRRLSTTHELFIVSASPEQAIEAVLSRESLLPCFTAILSANVPGTKADKIAPHVGVASLFVGDSGSDIRAARTVGIPAIAVTWGWQDEGFLRAHSPAEVVENTTELLESIRRLSGATGPA